MGVHWKIWFLVLSHKKAIYRGGLSKNGVLGQFADLRGHLAKILGGGFERGWYPIARYEKLNHRSTGFFLGIIF